MGRTDEQLMKAVAAAKTRPEGLDAMPPAQADRDKADWVDSWGGSACLDPSKKAAWWKASKVHHSKLIAAARERGLVAIAATQGSSELVDSPKASMMSAAPKAKHTPVQDQASAERQPAPKRSSKAALGEAAATEAAATEARSFVLPASLAEAAEASKAVSMEPQVERTVASSIAFFEAAAEASTAVSMEPQVQRTVAKSRIADDPRARSKYVLADCYYNHATDEISWGPTREQTELRERMRGADERRSPDVTVVNFVRVTGALTLPYLTSPDLTLPYLALPCLTLPHLTLPYLTEDEAAAIDAGRAAEKAAVEATHAAEKASWMQEVIQKAAGGEVPAEEELAYKLYVRTVYPSTPDRTFLKAYWLQAVREFKRPFIQEAWKVGERSRGPTAAQVAEEIFNEIAQSEAPPSK